MQELLDPDRHPAAGFGQVCDTRGRVAELLPVTLPLGLGLRRVAILTAVVDEAGRLCLGVIERRPLVRR